jgi:hypothetical protein
MITNVFSPLSFFAVFGSGMGKNQDTGSATLVNRYIPGQHDQHVHDEPPGDERGILFGKSDRSLPVCPHPRIFPHLLQGWPR